MMSTKKAQPVSRLKTKYTRDLEVEVVNLKDEKMSLVTSLEIEGDKVKDLRKERDRSNIRLAKYEEQFSTALQAMTFIVAYCAREVREDVPVSLVGDEFQSGAFKLVMGTPEGSVMAWSIAKNWLEGHWSHVGSDNGVLNRVRDWE
jgi:hypothetical protein